MTRTAAFTPIGRAVRKVIRKRTQDIIAEFGSRLRAKLAEE